MKISRILAICVICICASFGIDTNALARLYTDEPKVIEQTLDSSEYYVIFTPVLANKLESKNPKLDSSALSSTSRARANLYAKSQLFAYLKKDDSSLKAIRFSRFESAFFSSGSQTIVLSWLKKQHLTKLYTLQSTDSKANSQSLDSNDEATNTIDESDFKATFQNLAISLEAIPDKDLPTLQTLAKTYFELKDIENYERIQNIILDTKFK